MKIAIPLCRGRVAPLFDVAESIFLVDSESSGSGITVSLRPDLAATEKCHWLATNGVSILLCGALSCSLEQLLHQLGIEVYAFLVGEVQDVLQAYLHEGSASLVRYVMPGRGNGVGMRNRHRQRRRYCDSYPLIKE